MKSPRSRRLVWLGAAVWILTAASAWAVMVWPNAVFGLAALLGIASLFVALGLRPAGAKRETRKHAPRFQPPAVALKLPEPAPFHCPVLRPEDEAEVERLYQLLKTVGRLDSRSSSDET